MLDTLYFVVLVTLLSMGNVSSVQTGPVGCGGDFNLDTSPEHWWSCNGRDAITCYNEVSSTVVKVTGENSCMAQGGPCLCVYAEGYAEELNRQLLASFDPSKDACPSWNTHMDYAANIILQKAAQCQLDHKTLLSLYQIVEFLAKPRAGCPSVKSCAKSIENVNFARGGGETVETESSKKVSDISSDVNVENKSVLKLSTSRRSTQRELSEQESSTSSTSDGIMENAISTQEEENDSNMVFKTSEGYELGGEEKTGNLMNSVQSSLYVGEALRRRERLPKEKVTIIREDGVLDEESMKIVNEATDNPVMSYGKYPSVFDNYVSGMGEIERRNQINLTPLNNVIGDEQLTSSSIVSSVHANLNSV